MICYNYDGTQNIYELSPLDGTPLLPNRTTITPPPVCAQGFYLAFVDAEWVQIPSPAQQAPTNTEIIAELTASLEDHYDLVARAKQYDNRLTCALRAGYAGPFQAEGTAFAVWMDNCNAYAYEVLADCLSGARGIPTAEELIAEMPDLVWPV